MASELKIKIAPVTAAPVDKCAAQVARLAACTTHHCRKKANRRLRRCRGIPARRRRNRRIRRIIRRARRRAVVVPCAVQIAAVAACTTHHCRKKANRRLRRCRGIPPRRRTIPRPLPAVKPVPCARKIRALARCTTRKCRKAARRALRRCRGLPRRKRRIVRRVVTRRPAHVCDRQRIRLARCTSRKCRIIQRCAYRRCHCHGGVRRLVKILKIAQRRACLCGDVDSDCVDRRYKKVMAIKKRISREKSVCRRKEHKSCRAARRVKRIIRRQIKAKKIVPKRKRVCGHRNKLARASMRRLKVRRTSLFAAVKRCGDEEPRCAQRLLKKVLLINSKIRLLAKRCKIVLPKLKKRPLRRIVRKLRTCGKHIYSESWRNEVACPNINSNFKRWVRFWNCRRRVLFAEHKRCSPLDLSCQRFAFVQIIHIHRRLRQGRNDVTELLNTCNDCYPLRMQFRRWLRRQQARRRRFHRRILRCRNKDIPCQARNVEQIRVIQANIRTRRAHVIAMHAQCQQRGGTQNGFMQTYMQNVQVHTAAAESETISRLMSSASSIGVSVIAVVLAILVVM